MNKSLFRFIWITFWSVLAISIWLFFVRVVAGSLTGKVHIDTIDVSFFGNCTVESIEERTCEMGYEFEGKKYLFVSDGTTLPLQVGSTNVPLGALEENEWEAFFELPSHYFDRNICATVSGSAAPQSTLFLRLDAENPDDSLLRVREGRGCVSFVEEGHQLFTIQDHSFEGIEFSENLQRRVMRILSNSVENFEEGPIDSSEIEDLHLSIELTSELADGAVLKVVYFVALILTLHPLVLLIEYGVFIGESMHLIIKKYWK